MRMALVISGKIVPLDRADPEAVFKGRVFLDDSGSIERVTAGNAAGPNGFASAPVVDVGDAFVLPGLIDLHSHIGYNSLPLWAEKTQKTPFVHHDSWTRAPSYQGSISWPAKALATAAPEALLAYVQLRALVGGTSAIQGWPIANHDYVQVLRDIDDETAGTTNHNLIYTSALTLTRLDLGKKAQAEKQGAGFIYHCAEGQTGSLVLREFIDASNAGCLDKTFIGIHCNAVTPTDWQRWPKSAAGTLVWSPFSNLWLYGMTTDIASARKQDISICVGSDWGPSGSKNIQGEIKVAKLVSQKLGLGLTDRDLVAMITTNPGDALSRCWKKNVGRISAGAFGDITVFRARGTKSVWTQVVASTESDVMLVVQGGVPRYGDAALMTKAGLTKSSPITVRGTQRRFAIPDPEKPTDVWSWHDITSQLDAVIKDPAAALKHAESRRRAFAGSMDAPDAPLELELDMPTGALAIAGDISDHAAEIKIPPLPTLVHDAAFFKSIKGRGFHGGLLDGLASFYP
jgi:cytosine/adenosine deaminase-related metal-dependent hydrolase